MSRRLSDSSDDSSASDISSELLPPLFNCEGNQEENFQWKLEALNDELGKKIKELNSDFNKNHPTLTDQLKELQNITDELESMHKKNKVGILSGAALGAAGGITTIAGICLAPFTFGASLALTGVGAAVGIAGGATSAGFTINSMIKSKNLCETFEKIIKDAQNTIKSMIEQLSEIYDNIQEIDHLKETMEKEGVTTVRCDIDISELQNEIGKVSTLAAKDMLVFVQADNVASAVVDAAEAAYVAARVAKTAKAGAVTGVLSALFVVFDVVCVFQNSIELSEINQSADNKNKENIKLDVLKCIHQTRQNATVFQKTLDNIERLRNSINQEFNKMLQSSTSSQAKPKGTIINKNSLFYKCL